jgi:hypothetical protein
MVGVIFPPLYNQLTASFLLTAHRRSVVVLCVLLIGLATMNRSLCRIVTPVVCKIA